MDNTRVTYSLPSDYWPDTVQFDWYGNYWARRYWPLNYWPRGYAFSPYPALSSGSRAERTPIKRPVFMPIVRPEIKANQG